MNKKAAALCRATTRRRAPTVVGLLVLASLLTACESNSPSELDLAEVSLSSAASREHDHHSAAGDTKAFIGGWLNGEPVLLRYTRPYYCEAPRGASAETFCEVGTPPEDFPRPGNIPKIYALAPVGFTPDPSTVHCTGGVVCPNHPPTLDVPPLGDAATNVRAPAHSHIITERQGGWHNTVNIRVTNAGVWNRIVANPTLETVRALQADPLYGGATPPLISPDVPTNVFFFFEVHNARARR